jgi:hypothetical protein
MSHPVSELGRRRTGNAPFVARSRRELLRHLQTIVVDVAPGWRDDESVVILVTDQRIGRAEIQNAYDELDEHYRLCGIELRFDAPEVRLRAVCGPRS